MKNIYLVRHGQSEANVDLDVHAHTTDHAINLTEEGYQQAVRTGQFFKEHFHKLADELGEMPNVRLWVSPYERTVQTAQGILENTSDIFGEPFYENFLAEQQFGIFDGVAEEEWPTRFPEEFRHYEHVMQHQGKFWVRYPGGESLLLLYW